MKVIIHFKGSDFALDRFVALSEVKTYQVGSLQCDWEYGFDILLDGNTIAYHKPRKHVNIDRENYKSEIEGDRKLLLDKIRENTTYL